MNIENVLLVLQIVICITLIAAVTVQAKGTGLSGTFGGSGEMYRSKRGVEKIISNATIFLTVLFALVSILLLVI